MAYYYYQTFPSHKEDKRAATTTTTTTANLSSPPLLYNSPSVSSALITAFGRPTLIEYDIVADNAVEEEEFTPVRHQHRGGSQSLYSEQQPDSIGGELRRRSRSLSKSSYDDRRISAYTYRITRRRRSKSFSFQSAAVMDKHRLIMCRNTDGTYSHVDSDGEPLEPSAADDDSTTALESFQSSNNVSAEAIRTLRESITDYDHLPPHAHPVVPPEIVHPSYTSTSPPLKLLPLAALVFYNVSGGPFGIEPSIRSAGNFYAVAGFIIFPFIWAIPEALVTAELGGAFRDPSAGVAWVEEAFGERTAGMCGYLGWISGATDNVSFFIYI